MYAVTSIESSNIYIYTCTPKFVERLMQWGIVFAANSDLLNMFVSVLLVFVTLSDCLAVDPSLFRSTSTLADPLFWFFFSVYLISENCSFCVLTILLVLLTPPYFM